ncbi:hypothetical protein, partial [Escherichia coli]|uniref:hypothetical protein n=1 Tax=Escherichia coli TaxID=562 RepID=UPI002281F06D
TDVDAETERRRITPCPSEKSAAPMPRFFLPGVFCGAKKKHLPYGKCIKKQSGLGQQGRCLTQRFALSVMTG